MGNGDDTCSWAKIVVTFTIMSLLFSPMNKLMGENSNLLKRGLGGGNVRIVQGTLPDETNY
jgi:hypothetical protein